MAEPPGVVVRYERPGDEDGVSAVNRRAFARTAEARLVDRLRAAGRYECALVAEEEGRIVGHIVFTRVAADTQPEDVTLVGLGPVAVDPDRQGNGIGALLCRTGIARVAAAGADAVVLLGHDTYYPRFGFTPAGRHGLRYRDVPEDSPHFMCLEITPGTLLRVFGEVRYPPEFSE